jgi:hypothetical protein
LELLSDDGVDQPHDHVPSLIGRTPLVRLSRLEPVGVVLYAKLEAANPGSPVKDRAALAMIEDARERGVLRPGQTVDEATSVNTGISPALVCARLGHPLVVVIAENFSVERRRLMRFYGARVVLTPAHLRGSGSGAAACPRTGRRLDPRPAAPGADVRARVVRVLLGAAAHFSGASALRCTASTPTPSRIANQRPSCAARCTR